LIEENVHKKINMEIKEALNAFVSIFGRDENDYGEVHFNNNDYTDANDLDLLYKHLSFDKMLTIGGSYILIYIQKAN